MSCRRALDGSGETFTYYFEGFDLRADRRDRRRRHHLAARAPRWREELGLSLLLAAGRHSEGNYILQGRHAEARKLFDSLLSRCNDVGLLSEEFDPMTGRMLGNFPQAYSHVGLINCAINLNRQTGPAEERAESGVPRVAP